MRTLPSGKYGNEETAASPDGKGDAVVCRESDGASGRGGTGDGSTVVILFLIGSDVRGGSEGESSDAGCFLAVCKGLEGVPSAIKSESESIITGKSIDTG